jgi:hypothetical protein
VPKKPIEMREAGPHPWRVQKSNGGKLYIYAANEQQPIEVIRPRLRLTRRELAQLQLICDAVNYFRERNPQFR